MATSKEFLNFVLDQLSDLDGITYRQMMGEYIIYYGYITAAKSRLISVTTEC